MLVAGILIRSISSVVLRTKIDHDLRTTSQRSFPARSQAPQRRPLIGLGSSITPSPRVAITVECGMSVGRNGALRACNVPISRDFSLAAGQLDSGRSETITLLGP